MAPVALILVLVAAWHGYLWLRLVHGTALSPRWRTRGTAALVFLALLAALSIFRPRWFGGTARELILPIGFAWLGFGFLLACALAVTELVRALRWARARASATRRPSAHDPARREALARTLGGVAAVTAGTAALAGATQALALTLQRVEVPLRRLPASLSGVRIVQISDLHFGIAVGPEYLARVIAEVNALQPDLIAITGDLVDGSVERLAPSIAKLRELRARWGVYFVTGNHEYYSGAVEWVAHLETLGLRVLRNERVEVGGPEGSFDLAGVDDWGAASSGTGHGHGHDLGRALAGRDPTREVVLLAHQPVSVLEASRHGVGLQLSGHTHGGQIFPLKFLMYLDQPFVDGLHRLADTYIYVSRGTGYWGPPMRVGAAAEITEITLVAAPGAARAG